MILLASTAPWDGVVGMGPHNFRVHDEIELPAPPAAAWWSRAGRWIWGKLSTHLGRPR